MDDNDLFAPLRPQKLKKTTPPDEETKPVAEPDSEQAAAAAERAAAVLWVRGQVAESVPIAGTQGERYLIEHRGLRGPVWPGSLRWAERYRPWPDACPRECLLATVTNSSGEIVAVHSIEIDPTTGEKSRRNDRPKMSRGPVSEGAVFLGIENEAASVMALGEGVETALTRRVVGPCDAYACLGVLRLINPKQHHRRVEILADTNARSTARRLAREYAQLGLPAYVVTVPDMLGPKADLNDALCELGETAVLMAIEDAEHLTTAGEPRVSDFDLQIGSDVEIAQRIIERLEELYGPIVFAEGRFWRFDRTHWMALDDDHLARFIHRADGATYLSGDGKLQIVKLNKSRVVSIIDAALKYRRQANFFASPPRGINSESGFIIIGDAGECELQPHARRWRQRHITRGRWPTKKREEFKDSLLAKYLHDAAAAPGDIADTDQEQNSRDKINLMSEVTGAVALGCGTRLRQPKAIVAYSPEGNTGKSTFLQLLRSLPNPEAVASVPPGKFSDEKYAYRLIGKTLNAADELPDRAVRSDVFKRMITGEPVPARDVYKSATDFVPIAQHVFSTNVLPSFAGGVDGGVLRRLLPLGFEHQLDERDCDPGLVSNILRDESDLLLDFAVEGACRLIRRGAFTIPSSSRDLLQGWVNDADPVRGWAAERLEVTAFENVIGVSVLYADFRGWCEEQGLKRDFLPSVKAFGKRLRGVDPKLKFAVSHLAQCRNARLRSAS
jgi:P4 family phage/plasmid primase-like protien